RVVKPIAGTRASLAASDPGTRALITTNRSQLTTLNVSDKRMQKAQAPSFVAIRARNEGDVLRIARITHARNVSAAAWSQLYGPCVAMFDWMKSSTLRR